MKNPVDHCDNNSTDLCSEVSTWRVPYVKQEDTEKRSQSIVIHLHHFDFFWLTLLSYIVYTFFS